MVAQNKVRTCEGNKVLLKEYLKSKAIVVVKKDCLKQIYIPYSLRTCAPNSQLPPYTSTMSGLILYRESGRVINCRNEL